MPFDLFLSAFVSLFVIVDPLGTATIFISLTRKQTKAEQKRIAIKAVTIAVILLIIFGIIGGALLEHMGVSLSAFRIAGGLLLFVTAFRMIVGSSDPDQINSEKANHKSAADMAVFPLAIPLLAGPGSMTAALMFMTSAHDAVEHSFVVAAIILVEIVALVSLLGAGHLAKFFGPTGNDIIARIMGILLAAMAVQFVADGIKGIVLGL